MSKCVVIASGAAMCLGSAVETGLGIDGKGTWSYGAARVYVDINGRQGPNILGRDLFYFAIYKNGLIDDFGAVEDDAPLTEAQRQSVFNLACNKADTGSGWGCLGKIMNDSWQMNY